MYCINIVYVYVDVFCGPAHIFSARRPHTPVFTYKIKSSPSHLTPSCQGLVRPFEGYRQATCLDLSQMSDFPFFTLLILLFVTLLPTRLPSLHAGLARRIPITEKVSLEHTTVEGRHTTSLFIPFPYNKRRCLYKVLSLLHLT